MSVCIAFFALRIVYQIHELHSLVCIFAWPWVGFNYSSTSIIYKGVHGNWSPISINAGGFLY